MQKSYLHNIDNINYHNNVLEVKGWIFNINEKINNLNIVVYNNKQKYTVKLSDISKERNDVKDVYRDYENALFSGFYCKIKIENINKALIYLEVDNSYEILLMKIKGSFLNKIKYYKRKLNKKNIKRIILLIKKKNFESLKASANKIIIEEINEKERTINLHKFIKENIIDSLKYDENLYKCCIDIIIPVYNGYEYLTKLFATINQTKMKYRLIIINDKSSDERINKFLEKYKNRNPNVILINNEENLGFVKTVNKGLKISNNHVVLLNTDVELPNMWLERLMSPIILKNNVATSTPFTNSGTICSFPIFCENNEIFEGLNLEYIDKTFLNIKPRYTILPTGVGYCMGINRKALDKVGLLDSNTFGKGYGEENDWCQRAIKAGYDNVQVENLFVYHKHGGSFLSEEKKKLLEKNMTLLEKKHPNYLIDIENFCKIDPVRDIREYVMFKIICSKENHIRVYFNHNIGGGATNYLKKQIDSNNNEIVNITIKYDLNNKTYFVICNYKAYEICYSLNSVKSIIKFLNGLNIEEIYINELATYPDIYSLLHLIIELKNSKNSKLIMLLHDYFCICPSLNLINNEGNYCRLPPIEKCKACLRNNEFNYYIEYGMMSKWRAEWENFLKNCSEVRTFSNDSKKLLQKIYKTIPNISLIPHLVDYIKPLKISKKNSNNITIGLIGELNHHKGLDVVKDMLKHISKYNLDIRIVLIGSTTENIKDENFTQTGKYAVNMLPNLVIENNIDLFFITSIWPETFSYTTEEIIIMGLPIVSFDLGAQAERIRKYEKGLVLDSFSVKDALTTIIDFSRKIIN